MLRLMTKFEISFFLDVILIILIFFFNVSISLGQVYEKMEDENTACHWQTEAHRHYPVNLNVIRYH